MNVLQKRTLRSAAIGGGNISAARKTLIEDRLPPMAEMWNEWSRTVSQTFNPATGGANYSWKNDPSMAVQKLMKQVGTMNISHPQVLPIFIWLKVMIDGGLMSLPTCDETVSSCSLGGKATGCCASSRLVPTESGPCYHISVPGETIGGRGTRGLHKKSPKRPQHRGRTEWDVVTKGGFSCGDGQLLRR
jgi:hypothetical protein